MLNIVTSPNPILHTISRPVEESEFGPELLAHLSEMKIVLAKSRGAGLASVQVGDARRIILVMVGGSVVEMINPIISKASMLRKSDVEGCLSFPGQISRSIPRARQVTVDYRAPSGEASSITLTGFEARCVQHEIDHLNGKTIL